MPSREHLRWILRRIALGLPLAGLPLGPALLAAGCYCGSDRGPYCTSGTEIVTTTVGELVDRGRSPTRCESVCGLARSLGPDNPRRQVASCTLVQGPVIDASLPDAFLIDAWELDDASVDPDAAATEDAWSEGTDASAALEDAALEDAALEDAPLEDAALGEPGDGGTMDAGSDGGLDPVRAQVIRAECVIEECRPAGRRPSQLRLARRRSAGVSAWLSEVATLEAASVPAFAELRRELRAHGAPHALVRATVSAQRDEVRHARLVARLARRSGATPQRPAVRRAEPRTLAELAVHNASEGCVRESYGALSAYAQSLRASDPEVRRAFAEIARDEARHALLSLALDDWARPRLRAVERRRAIEAQDLAAEELRATLATDDASVRAVLGVPDEEPGRALVALCAA